MEIIDVSSLLDDLLVLEGFSYDEDDDNIDLIGPSNYDDCVVVTGDIISIV